MKKFIIAISCILMTVSLTYADSHKGPDYDYDYTPTPKQEQKQVPNSNRFGGKSPFEWLKILPDDYPKVKYPTAMIGQFMNFCGTIMMQRFRYENVQPQIAQA